MPLGLAIPEPPEEHWKIDGWRLALEQCARPHDVVELECQLNVSINFAVKRNIAMPHARALIRMCEQRWHELAAECGMTPRGRR